MKCKHRNGNLYEVSEIYHLRDVSNGKLSEEGINEIDNISYYEFRCNDCKMKFKFYKKFPKWFEKYHKQLLKEQE